MHVCIVALVNEVREHRAGNEKIKKKVTPVADGLLTWGHETIKSIRWDSWGF